MDNRSVHHDEHIVPARPVESRAAAFHTGLGAVFNRTGDLGGTEESEAAHDVAGAAREAAQAVAAGVV